MQPFEIEWKCFMKVKNEFKARKLVRRMESALGLECENMTCHPYYKDDPCLKDGAVHEVHFLTRLPGESTFGEAVVKTLQLVHAVGYRWSVGYPGTVPTAEGEQFSFDGICNHARVTGVEWVSFVLCGK